MTRDSEQVTLVLAPAGGSWSEIPSDIRLRRAIKALGRSFGLTVVSCRPAPVSEPETSAVVEVTP